ncbi:carbohydrate sulfotransferase 5 [Lingula anatina]|uniref:Carbohydrate sulfotransferase 5 n=1 Tax=Lingula anatina TaxID=7574 RepID=A0A1S3IVH9_LINAN|nr:carbohydrate sulfotransferase 5 [Lingula anatina]|eukprot:XP_013402197.1 carbohydrate sulfotransferase 5 [Lingula anatina]
MAILGRVWRKHVKTLFFMYVIAVLCLFKVFLDVSLIGDLSQWEDVEAARGHSHRNTSKQTTDKVLIITYQRSGSSFLAELFNQNPEAYYLFEPLWGFYNSVDKDRAEYMLYYPDKSTRKPPERGLEYNMSLDIIHSLLTCQLDRVPMQILAPKGLHHPFFTDENRHKYQDKYKKCILRARTRSKDVECVPLMKDVCNKSTLKAFKMLRLRMKHLPQLMELHPGLKIIHLVRDPRGILWSRRRLGRQYFRMSTENEGSILCLSMLQDIQARKELEKIYPGRFLQIRYEDNAAKPTVAAFKVYDFLGFNVPRPVNGWLLDSITPVEMSSNDREARRRIRKMRSSFSTVRNDPKKTSHMWLRQMPSHMAYEVDEYCKEVLEYLGYEKVSKLLQNETLMRSLGPEKPKSIAHNFGQPNMRIPNDGVVVKRRILPDPNPDPDEDEDEESVTKAKRKTKVWKIVKNAAGKNVVANHGRITSSQSKKSPNVRTKA